MNLHRRSFLATLGTVASSFFILPSATTYERVWRSIVGTPMDIGGPLQWTWVKNVGTGLIVLEKAYGDFAKLNPGQGMVFSGAVLTARNISRANIVERDGITEKCLMNDRGGKLLVMSIDT